MSNGLKVVLAPRRSATCTVCVVYRVGSRHENRGEGGLAHVLEHMLFRPAQGHADIPAELARHGGQANASTSFDRTEYHTTFAASQPTLRWALELEAARMRGSLLRATDLAREMRIVRNEWQRTDSNPDRLLVQRAFASAYRWHPYHNPTIGHADDIAAIAPRALKAFYSTWYRPDNATLIIAGAFDPRETLRQAESTLGLVPLPKQALPQRQAVEPPQDGERLVRLQRASAGSSLVAVYHIPPAAGAEFVALDLGLATLATEPDGPLYQSLVKAGKAVSVLADCYPLHDAGLALVQVRLSAQHDLEQVSQLLLAALEHPKGERLAGPALEHARLRLLAQSDAVRREAEKLALELADWEGMGDWRLFYAYRERLRTTTVQQVEAALGHYLQACNRTLAVLSASPTGSEVKVPSVRGLPSVSGLGVLERTPTGPLRAPSTKGGEHDDAADCITLEKNTQRLRLRAGLNLALVARHTEGNRVYAQLRLHLGSLEALRGRAAAGTLCPLVLARGTHTRTRTELRDALDALGSELTVTGGPTAVTVALEADAWHLSETLDLVTDILRHPRLDPLEIEQVKKEQLDSIARLRTGASQACINEMRRGMASLPPDDVRYMPTPDEEMQRLAAVTPEEVQAFYRDFVGAGCAEMAVVGDTDVDRLLRWMASTLQDWKAPSAYQRVGPTYQNLAGSTTRCPVPKQSNAACVVSQGFPLGDCDADCLPLQLANHALGGSFLSSRLAVRLRGELALAYAVGSTWVSYPLEAYSQWTLQVSSAPLDLERVQQEVHKVIQEVVRDGFSDDEINAARQGLLQQWRTERSDIRALVGQLRGQAYLGRTWKDVANDEKRLAALQAREVNEVLRRRWPLGRLRFYLSTQEQARERERGH